MKNLNELLCEYKCKRCTKKVKAFKKDVFYLEDETNIFCTKCYQRELRRSSVIADDFNF